MKTEVFCRKVGYNSRRWLYIPNTSNKGVWANAVITMADAEVKRKKLSMTGK